MSASDRPRPTMHSTEIAGLLERVRAATGPDHILDRRLCAALGIEPWTGRAAAWGVENVMPGSPVAKATPRLTASIDAALALVERVLPGVFYLLAKGRTRADEPLYAFELLFGTDEILGEAEHNDPCLAILAALLTAIPGGPDAG